MNGKKFVDVVSVEWENDGMGQCRRCVASEIC
jgi:hypothetical protein